MPLAQHRRFDHFAIELSLALETRVPRLALWTAAARHLASGAALAEFCDGPLDAFLCDQRLRAPSPRARAKLRRRVAHFDPARRTPEEVLAGLFSG